MGNVAWLSDSSCNLYALLVVFRKNSISLDTMHIRLLRFEIYWVLCKSVSPFQQRKKFHNYVRSNQALGSIRWTNTFGGQNIKIFLKKCLFSKIIWLPEQLLLAASVKILFVCFIELYLTFSLDTVWMISFVEKSVREKWKCTFSKRN